MRGIRLSTCILVGCGVALAVSLALLAFTLSTAATRGGKPQSSQLVREFFQEYLSSDRDRSSDEGLIEKYFDTTSTPEAWGNYEEYTLARMFYERADEFYSFEIEDIAPGFVKISLVQESGEWITPPIGFWYKINNVTSKIGEWGIGHLQPFSRYDTEYSEVFG